MAFKAYLILTRLSIITRTGTRKFEPQKPLRLLTEEYFLVSGTNLCSGGRIRTYNPLLTRYPRVSMRGGLYHHPMRMRGASTLIVRVLPYGIVSTPSPRMWSLARDYRGVEPTASPISPRVSTCITAGSCVIFRRSTGRRSTIELRRSRCFYLSNCPATVPKGQGSCNARSRFLGPQ
jgi:hypothetical protein